MILISIFIIITGANIKQLRWHQEKFYLITKINYAWEINYKYIEVWENFYQKIDYDVGDSIFITSWHLELSNKRIRTFNWKKIH